MEQKRLLLAFALSAVILFGWSYLFTPPTPPPAENPPATTEPTATPAPVQTATPAPVQTATPAGAQVEAPASAPDSTPQRTLKVSTPLFEVDFDSRGAIAKSWIIKQNKGEGGKGKPLYSIASTSDNRQPLQLVSPKGVEQGQAPLKIITGRAEIDSALSSRNYLIGGVEGNAAE